MANEKPKTIAQDGHVPLKKGWVPTVQGGYKPATSTLSPPPSPPSGGSGVKSPKK
jgi:hypothetical protein